MLVCALQFFHSLPTTGGCTGLGIHLPVSRSNTWWINSSPTLNNSSTLFWCRNTTFNLELLIFIQAYDLQATQVQAEGHPSCFSFLVNIKKRLIFTLPASVVERIYYSSCFNIFSNMNVGGLFCFPEVKRELVLKMKRKKWRLATKYFHLRFHLWEIDLLPKVLVVWGIFFWPLCTALWHVFYAS